MSEDESETYHRAQVDVFARSEADMVCAITMNYVEEAVGIARAAKRAGIPVAISFTLETDGKLPTGQSLKDAIERVDAQTDAYPAYYMINCAHPSHFEQTFYPVGAWLERIRGLRANASRKSHAELNESLELDIGDPDELGTQYLQLTRQLFRLNVMGGCCGTDHRHVEKIALSCSSRFNTRR
jgi:S-methylmethionine-dependent homocysteine/selenocysteine methylase